eukprot:scaffold97738_cov13-Tisochrysis_lutea.AAC.1
MDMNWNAIEGRYGIPKKGGQTRNKAYMGMLTHHTEIFMSELHQWKTVDTGIGSNSHLICSLEGRFPAKLLAGL